MFEGVVKLSEILSLRFICCQWCTLHCCMPIWYNLMYITVYVSESLWKFCSFARGVVPQVLGLPCNSLSTSCCTMIMNLIFFDQLYSWQWGYKCCKAFKSAAEFKLHLYQNHKKLMSNSRQCGDTTDCRICSGPEILCSVCGVMHNNLVSLSQHNHIECSHGNSVKHVIQECATVFRVYEPYEPRFYARQAVGGTKCNQQLSQVNIQWWYEQWSGCGWTCKWRVEYAYYCYPTLGTASDEITGVVHVVIVSCTNCGWKLQRHFRNEGENISDRVKELCEAYSVSD